MELPSTRRGLGVDEGGAETEEWAKDFHPCTFRGPSRDSLLSVAAAEDTVATSSYIILDALDIHLYLHVVASTACRGSLGLLCLREQLICLCLGPL